MHLHASMKRVRLLLLSVWAWVASVDGLVRLPVAMPVPVRPPGLCPPGLHSRPSVALLRPGGRGSQGARLALAHLAMANDQEQETEAEAEAEAESVVEVVAEAVAEADVSIRRITDLCSYALTR